MQTPSPQRPPQTEQPEGSLLSIFLALMLGMGVLSGLLLLTGALFGPKVLVGVLLVVGIFLVIVFHYLVWGWWLGKVIRREAEEEEREAS